MRIGVPPISLVLAVLGSIVGGIAAPTEAASMGALGSILVVALSGRFSWSVLRETTLSTTRITAGMMFILICAQVFALAFRGLHGEQLVADLFTVVPGGVHGILIFMMALIFVLGFFIEWIEISYIVVPLFLPLLLNLNVDLVWVATLIAVNLQTSFLTPPFGWALFYLRSVAPGRGPDDRHLQGRGAVHPAAGPGERCCLRSRDRDVLPRATARRSAALSPSRQ
jgi:TRAP-type mannitol/chloroaromatic compound transport system permease large subunit